MARIALMATTPAGRETVMAAVQSLCRQVDRLALVLLDYPQRPREWRLPANVGCVIARDNLGAASRLLVDAAPEDAILLCRDDLAYPADYAERLLAALEAHRVQMAVVGVEGAVLADLYDGGPRSRLLVPAEAALPKDCHVNLLDTGMLACRGYQLPALESMAGASEAFDLHFAVHCQRLGYPRLSIARPAGWLRAAPGRSPDLAADTAAPASLVALAQEIAGFRHLPALAA